MVSKHHKGVVAAGHTSTAQAGADILAAGGNAFDAAIASLAMACVCEPVLASPGGGGFAIAACGDGPVSLIDFFVQTPLLRRQFGETGCFEVLADFGTATQAFHIGPATSATPGFLPGLSEIHKFGASMPMSTLLNPAIEAARQGVVVTKFQAYLASVVAPILKASPQATALFAPDGELHQEGAVFCNPALSQAFEAYLYDEAQLRDQMVSAQKAHGNLTASDFDAYRAITRTPLEVDLGEWQLYLNPLPAASGILIAHSLSQVSKTPDPTAFANALLETSRARRAAQGELGKLENSIMRQRGTTHVSVIDAKRNACAVTVSNGEGNGEIIDGYGFMLNNMLGEEDVNPGLGAHWPVDTRLSSMMCPTLIRHEDGTMLALGSGGSNRIRSAIFEVVARHCLNDTDIEAAIRAPRLHVEREHLDLEGQFESAEIKRLTDRFPDHRIWPEPNMYFGGVHAARIDIDGACLGAGDTRRDGVSIVVE